MGTETSFSENLSEAGFHYAKNLKGPDGKVYRGWRGLEKAKDEGFLGLRAEFSEGGVGVWV